MSYVTYFNETKTRCRQKNQIFRSESPTETHVLNELLNGIPYINGALNDTPSDNPIRRN